MERAAVGRLLISERSRSWSSLLASELRRLRWWRTVVVVVADMDLEAVGLRRQQKKYSPAISMGRAAVVPIEIPRMADLDRPDVSPLPVVLFALLSFVLLSSLLLLLSLLLSLVLPPGLPLLGPASEPGVAVYMSVFSPSGGPP